MKYTTKATNIKLTDEIVDYIDKKMAALNKFAARLGQSAEAHVEVERTTRHHRKGDIFRVEVRVSAPGKNLHAEARGETVLEAMDKVKDEIALELERYKEKDLDLKKRGARKAKAIMKGI